MGLTLGTANVQQPFLQASHIYSKTPQDRAIAQTADPAAVSWTMEQVKTCLRFVALNEGYSQQVC